MGKVATAQAGDESSRLSPKDRSDVPESVVDAGGLDTGDQG